MEKGGRESTEIGDMEQGQSTQPCWTGSPCIKTLIPPSETLEVTAAMPDSLPAWRVKDWCSECWSWEGFSRICPKETLAWGHLWNWTWIKISGRAYLYSHGMTIPNIGMPQGAGSHAVFHPTFRALYSRVLWRNSSSVPLGRSRESSSFNSNSQYSRWKSPG